MNSSISNDIRARAIRAARRHRRDMDLSRDNAGLLRDVVILREQLAAVEADRDAYRKLARRNGEYALALQATLAELGGAATNVARAAIAIEVE